jgi:hypothetical protein
VTEKQKLKE